MGKLVSKTWKLKYCCCYFFFLSSVVSYQNKLLSNKWLCLKIYDNTNGNTRRNYVATAFRRITRRRKIKNSSNILCWICVLEFVKIFEHIVPAVPLKMHSGSSILHPSDVFFLISFFSLCLSTFICCMYCLPICRPLRIILCAI